MAYIGVSPSNGVRRVHTYTATASQTTFTGAGAEGTSLSYKDSNYVDVYQNGIKLGDADYTSTSGTSIVLAQGASVDDLVVVVVFDVFSVADTVSKADGGTFDGNVTMAGTLGVTGNQTNSGNLTVSGAFTSQGIDDNADATAITILSDENIGIGTTSITTGTLGTSNKFLEVGAGTASGSGTLVLSRDTTTDNDEVGGIRFVNANNADDDGLDADGKMIAAVTSRMETSDSNAGDDSGGHLLFSTKPEAGNFTERMRINSSGYVGIGSDSPSEPLLVYNPDFNGAVVRILNIRDTSNANGIKVTIGSSGGASGTNSTHFHGNTNAVGNWYLYANGTTSYSSDERLKKNIETTRDGYLEDLAKLRVVKYNWNCDKDGDNKELGLIAQEVEKVFPNLVKDDTNPISEDDPTMYKQLKQSVLPMMLLKALQEANTKITALEARITALENAE